jgi:hypothetical protein
MEINPSFRGALLREPGIHSHHWEYGFRACANGASRNDAGVCGALRSIRGTTDAVGPDYLSAAIIAAQRPVHVSKHELTCRLTWTLPVRQSHKRIFHESMLSI